MDESIRQEMVKRLRLSRDAEAPDVLDFWRQHGTDWAREEASFTEIKRMVDICRAAAAQPMQDAAPYAVGELKAIWRAGWPGSMEPYGWDEMNDMLPALAYLAFLQGVEAAWNEVSDRV
jgi:hypothetical protein